MKFSFGCLGAVLAPVVVMAHDIEQQSIAASAAASAAASTVIRDNILNVRKDHLRSTSSSSSSSSYSKVKDSPVHKRLAHGVAVRHQPNQLRNSEFDGDDEVDVDGKVNEVAAGTMKTNSATTPTNADTTIAVTAASGKEACVPPVSLADMSKLDSGHLPLSSCSSKKQVCIDVEDQKEPSSSSSSSSSSIKTKTGYCLEMVWDLPPSYSTISSTSNEDASSTYWGDSGSTSYAATSYSTHKEDDGLNKPHHLGGAGSSGDPTTTIDQHSYHHDVHDHDDRMYEQQDQGDYDHATNRNLADAYDCSDCPSRPLVQSNNNFQQAIDKCFGNQGSSNCPYPDVNINCWDVSLVTEMDSAFEDKEDFNSPLGCWNTASVTKMEKMFRKAKQFDQDINSWNTGKVEYMTSMFEDAESFDSPLNGWDTESVSKMERTFAKTDNFNQEINSWNTGKVMYMIEMFQSAMKFNSPIGGWDTSLVTHMQYMFYAAEDFNQPIDGWNIGNVANLSETFAFAYKFNQPLEGWDTGYVGNLYGTFRAALEFDQPIGDWDTQKVTDMGSLFSSYYEEYSYTPINLNPFNNDINAWDTGRVSNMDSMFMYSNFNSPIGNWDVSKVEYMEYMFYGARNFNQPIGEWNPSKVAYMNYMFSGSIGYDDNTDDDYDYAYYPCIFNQAIEKWDVGNVIEMYGMFEYATSFNQPLDNWNVQSLNNTGKMFYEAYEFNQCLATWAEKTMPVYVNTTKMFLSTSCPCLDDSSGECANPDGPWCQTADICPGIELTCKDNKKAKFMIPKKGNKFKKTKCKKIKERDCNEEFDLQKKVDGVKTDVKPKDVCVCSCNPTECRIDDTSTELRIKDKNGKIVKGKTNCPKIKEKGHCKGTLKDTDDKLKNVCKFSCGKC